MDRKMEPIQVTQRNTQSVQVSLQLPRIIVEEIERRIVGILTFAPGLSREDVTTWMAASLIMGFMVAHDDCLAALIRSQGGSAVACGQIAKLRAMMDQGFTPQEILQMMAPRTISDAYQAVNDHLESETDKLPSVRPLPQ